MDEEDKDLLKELLSWREERKADRIYSARQYDKLIVYLSGGGLVITTGISSNIIKLNEAANPIIIVLSWALFTLALISNLISQLSSRRSMEIEIERTNLEIEQIQDNTKKGPSSKLICKVRFYSFLTKLFNHLSFGCLLTATILFTIFVSITVL